MGGLGSGKTLAGSHEHFLLGMENPGLKTLIARKTYAELRDTTMRTFFDVVPIPLIKSFHKSENRLVLKNGSEYLFRSLDDPDKLKSLEIGKFWIDEGSETSKDIFLTLCGRLRQKGNWKPGGVITTNPPNTGHWLEDLFDGEKNGNNPEYELIKATTYENRANLPPGYIEDLEANYPAQWVKKFLFGDFGFTSGGKPVYPMFDEEIHVRDLTKYYLDRDVSGNLPRLVIYRGWDYGFNFPAVIWTSVDSKGRWLWLKEYQGREMTINSLIPRVRQLDKINFPNCKMLDYGDPAGNQRSDKNEKSTIEILGSHGIKINSRKSSPLWRSEIIARLLSKTIDGLPGLMVDKSCKIAIDALAGGYHYKKPKGEKFQQDEIEKDGFYDHIIDAGGYIAASLFTAPEERKRRMTNRIGNWKDYHKLQPIIAAKSL